MINREGPQVLTKTSLTCGLCRYHDQHMRKSGRNPEYDHYCKHPKAPKAMVSVILGPDAAWIGKSDSTPQWCPFLTGELMHP